MAVQQITDAAPGLATPSSNAIDRVVDLKVVRARFVRGSVGGRSLMLKVRTTEKVSLDIHLLRGTATVTHQTTSRARGLHHVRVPVGARVPGGRVIVNVVAKDSAKNTKTITKALRIPTKAH